MDLTVVGAAMPSIHLEQHIDWLRADQRDLEIQDFALPSLLDDGGWKDSVARIKQNLEGYTGRMGIHAPFWNLPLAAYDSKIRVVVQDRFKQSLDIAAEINATHMVIHSPLEFLGQPGSLSRPRIGFEDLFDIIHVTLNPAVEQAEAIGCTLVIENIYDQYPLMLTDLVKSFESEFVRQSLDVGHAFINYKLGAPPPDYYIREAGDMMGHIHLQDTDGFSDRHWSVGEGQVDWPPLFDEINALENKPRLILELRDHSKIQEAAKWFEARGIAR